jgi:hypothetical protein
MFFYDWLATISAIDKELPDFNNDKWKKCPYLVEALMSTTPDIASASSIVSADAFKASNSDPDTLSYDEAMWDKLSVDQWLDAAWKEILSLEAHGTWELDENFECNE